MTAAPGAVLERLPATTKLAALFCISVLLFLTTSLSLLGAAAGAILVACLLLCREALVQWLKAWPLLLTIGIFALWKAFADGYHEALVLLLRLGTLSLVATVVTVTTSIRQFIDTITRLARPLEKLGIGNARDIGLAIGLVMRLIPDVRQRYLAVVDAHRARGLPLRPSTLLVPMIIGMLKGADDMANAIDARGIRADTRTEKKVGHG
jgi:biotin transport system permease protein